MGSGQLEASGNCAICGRSFTPGVVRIPTVKYGVLCGACWSNKAGEIVDAHPVSDNEPHTTVLRLRAGESKTLTDGVSVTKKRDGTLEISLSED